MNFLAISNFKIFKFSLGYMKFHFWAPVFLKNRCYIIFSGTGFFKKPVPKVITLVAPVFYKKPVLDPKILAPVFIKNRCHKCRIFSTGFFMKKPVLDPKILAPVFVKNRCHKCRIFSTGFFMKKPVPEKNHLF